MISTMAANEGGGLVVRVDSVGKRVAVQAHAFCQGTNAAWIFFRVRLQREEKGPVGLFDGSTHDECLVRFAYR